MDCSLFIRKDLKLEIMRRGARHHTWCLVSMLTWSIGPGLYLQVLLGIRGRRDDYQWECVSHSSAWAAHKLPGMGDCAQRERCTRTTWTRGVGWWRGGNVLNVEKSVIRGSFQPLHLYLFNKLG